MKKIILIAFSIMWVTLLFGTENDRNFPSICVTGKSVINNKADNAKVFFSIEAESTSLQNSVSKAKAELNLITKKLTEQGLTKNDVSTSQFKSSDGYKFLFGLKNYKVIIDAEIKVNDLAQLENVIFILSNSKIKEISSIEFLLSNESEIFQQAQLNAIKAAKNKAELLAKELNVSIEGIYSANQLNSQKISAEFNFRRGSTKYASNPFNSVSIDETEQAESVFSGDIKIISEYEVVFKVVNP